MYIQESSSLRTLHLRANDVTIQPNRTLACISRLDMHDLCRGLRRTKTNRTLACISRIRHARSPQRVARNKKPNRALACISRPQHARSPQKLRQTTKSHSRLHFALSTRTISAEICAEQRQIALSPAFRAFDTHDLHRELPATKNQIALSPAFRVLNTHDLRKSCARQRNRTLACISRSRHVRSPQKFAPDKTKSHSRLHFAHPTRTISRGLRFAAVRLQAYKKLHTHAHLSKGLVFVLLLWGFYGFGLLLLLFSAFLSSQSFYLQQRWPVHRTHGVSRCKKQKTWANDLRSIGDKDRRVFTGEALCGGTGFC